MSANRFGMSLLQIEKGKVNQTREIGPSDIIYNIAVNLDPSLTWTWASVTPFMVLNHLEGKNAGASCALGLWSPLCKDINAIPVEDIHGFQVSGIQLSFSQQLFEWEESRQEIRRFGLVTAQQPQTHCRFYHRRSFLPFLSLAAFHFLSPTKIQHPFKVQV